MVRRSKTIRIPIEAKEAWERKKGAMEQSIAKITKKPRKLHMTEILTFFGQRPSYVYDDELVNYFLSKKKKRMGGLRTLL